MRTRLNEDLIELHGMLEKMGEKVSQAISGCVCALANKDKALATEIISNDKEVNKLEKEIERFCFHMLLIEQPVAYDLRNVSAAMKMITDLERIGDQAADICDIVLHAPDSAISLDYGHISEMSEITVYMVKKSIEAFITTDEDLAKKVCARDDEVDELFAKTKNDIVKLICEQASLGEQALDLLMIAKYFERIGDHATNIAEWAIYSVTGVHKDYNVGMLPTDFIK